MEGRLSSGVDYASKQRSTVQRSTSQVGNGMESKLCVGWSLDSHLAGVVLGFTLVSHTYPTELLA